MIKWNDTEFLGKVGDAMKAATDKACLVVVRSVRDHFKKGDKNNPSSPGEIPHVVTGNLKRSIGHELVSDEEGHVGPRLGFTGDANEEAHNYGFWLEYGTQRMAPRPYLRPGLARERKRILQIYKKAAE